MNDDGNADRLFNSISAGGGGGGRTDEYTVVAFSNDNGTFNDTSWTTCWCTGYGISTGDFNGDGKMDLYCHTMNGGNWPALSNGDGTFASTYWPSWCDGYVSAPPHSLPTQFVPLGDSNGDGEGDFLGHHN